MQVLEELQRRFYYSVHRFRRAWTSTQLLVLVAMKDMYATRMLGFLADTLSDEKQCAWCKCVIGHLFRQSTQPKGYASSILLKHHELYLRKSLS